MAGEEGKSMNPKTDFWRVTSIKQQDKIWRKFLKEEKSQVLGWKPIYTSETVDFTVLKSILHPISLSKIQY